MLVVKYLLLTILFLVAGIQQVIASSCAAACIGQLPATSFITASGFSFQSTPILFSSSLNYVLPPPVNPANINFLGILSCYQFENLIFS